MQKILIELKDVWKTYQMGDNIVHALRGVSFKIHEGEFVAVVGPSGSGKSTMMNIIGCLDIPTKGAVFLQGQNIAHLSESRLAQIRGRTIGFIFQQFNLSDINCFGQCRAADAVSGERPKNTTRTRKASADQIRLG